MASVVSSDDPDGGGEITSISEESMSGAGGLNATMKRIRVEFASGKSSTYVLKTIEEGRVELGLAREALFYKDSAAITSVGIPQVYYSSGDMKTGAKQILFQGTNYTETIVHSVTMAIIDSFCTMLQTLKIVFNWDTFLGLQVRIIMAKI